MELFHFTWYFNEFWHKKYIFSQDYNLFHDLGLDIIRECIILKITALNSKFFHKFLFLVGCVVRHQEDRCYCGIFYQSCYLRS